MSNVRTASETAPARQLRRTFPDSADDLGLAAETPPCARHDLALPVELTNIATREAHRFRSPNPVCTALRSDQ
jgi:hypothetical protein